MEQIDQFLAHYGYFAIFGLLMLGIVGPLIPDETILVLSGVAAQRGSLSLPVVIVVAFAGSLCGITMSYTLGRTGAIYVLERRGPWKRLVQRRLPEALRWFSRYGKWTLSFGYFFAGIRHFTALVAGISGLPFRTFALFAWPGGLVWVVSFVLLGDLAGSQWETIVHRFDRVALIATLVLAIAVVALWWVRRQKSA